MSDRSDILAKLKADIASIEQSGHRAAHDCPTESAAAGCDKAGCRMRPHDTSANHATEAEERGNVAPEKTAEAAFQKILHWVSVRERSSVYIRDRLIRDEYPPDAVEEALDRAVRIHAVDDRRYSDALIRMKLAAGRGLRDAETEIESLGIEPSSLDAWREHAERGSDAEVDRAFALLQRRPPRAKHLREAAFRKLVSQGYSTDVASTAARRWSEEAMRTSTQRPSRAMS